MLDSCSSGTFIDEYVATTLGLEGADTKLVVKTANGHPRKPEKIRVVFYCKVRGLMVLR